MARRADFVAGMQKDMYDWFYENYDLHEYIYTKYWDSQPSTGAFEQSTSAVGPGKLQKKNEGEDYQYRDPTEGDTVIGKNETFYDAVRFTQESVEDHQKVVADTIRDYSRQWADSYQWAKEDFFAKFMNKGGMNAGDAVFNGTITNIVTDPSGNVIYDGESFFNLAGDVAVRLSLAGTGYYNGHALDLNATNFETVWNLMTGTNNRNENDEVIAIKPNVLLVPTQLAFSARRMLESTLIPGRAENDTNVLQGIVDLVVNPYFDDTNAWFLGVRGQGLKAQERKAPELRFFRDEDNGDFKATINSRFGGRVTNWRYWSGSNFSTT